MVQFYSPHAACSHELFSKLWIDAGGERAMEEREIERVNVSMKLLQSYVLGIRLQREILYSYKLLYQH